MAKVITMGEIMLRLSTPGFERFLQANEFAVHYGGGEANVAVSLANYGHEAEFVTKVPENPIGERAVAELRKMNVATRHIARGGERLGIYFLETGAASRASDVVYDRAHSSISTATEEDFDFDEIFRGADWFHFSGITPALSESARKLTETACQYAKKHGLTVSCDVNYRAKLWTKEKAAEVMKHLMRYTDVCIDGDRILGVHPHGLNFSEKPLDPEEYREILRDLCEQYDLQYAISSLRVPKSASDNFWSACIYERKTDTFYHSREYRFHPIVDRVGGGDSFVGGTICGILDGKSVRDALEFGAAAAALKHTIPGDMNLVTRAEVERLAKGNGTGAVQR